MAADMSPPPPGRFEPPVVDPSKPFWEASRDRTLLIPWCDICERPHWYPRSCCPHCYAQALTWRPSTGSGVVHAVSWQHRAGWPGLADRVPYGVAVVELDDGVRMLSSLAEPGRDLAAAGDIGRRVTLAWEPLSDGRHLPVFSWADRTAV